jgi:hypothetical protein
LRAAIEAPIVGELKVAVISFIFESSRGFAEDSIEIQMSEYFAVIMQRTQAPRARIMGEWEAENICLVQSCSRFHRFNVTLPTEALLLIIGAS